MQNSVGQQYTIQQPQVCVQPPVSQQPVAPAMPTYQTPPQTQNIPIPNYSGVNIQIFNPSVSAPGGPAPVYNVNAPQYQTPSCYPSDYYTNQWGQPNGQNINGNNNANNNTNSNNNNTTTTTTTTTEEKKKTEKRNIVLLTDSYIKNLENYLNSQDKEIRLMGAKEVAARLQEDDSRRDDKALTALINKMLQDPYQPVKFLALAMLNNRFVTGDDYTAGVLEQMKNGTTGYGEDALLANEILLKMSGQVVKKEFEVTESDKKKESKK